MDTILRPSRRRYIHAIPYLVLSGGVLVAASSSIMIRLAQQLGMSSPLIAAGRLSFAALILLPLAVAYAGAELRALRRRDLLLGLAAGAFLAVHFSAWILSLEYTSVASSAALVATNPFWIALASLLLFRERLAPATWIGVIVTIAGSAIIGISDGGGADGANALLGDGLALLGALAMSSYLLVGRSLRRRLSTLAYIWLVYTSAAVILVVVALVAGRGSHPNELAGFPPVAYLLLLGLAIGPQLLGHTSFNWSLRHLSATFVAVAGLGEPIGSALLALLIFGQQFKQMQLLGFVILLIGIVVAARGEQRAAGRAETVGEPEATVISEEAQLTR
jgi:drug/metabolite transporter (DMT)-like permease